MAGWGGARVGSGRKPELVPVSMDEIEADPLMLPPSDLPPEQQEFWRAYAPRAIERQTLTEDTIASFRLLCELHAKKTMVSAMVDKGALGGLRVFMQLSKQIESLMARFCLAPFGKPAKTEKRKAPVNPWAQLK